MWCSETFLKNFLRFLFRLKRFPTRTNRSFGSSSSRSGPAWTYPKLCCPPSFWSQDLFWKNYLIITTTRIYLLSKNKWSINMYNSLSNNKWPLLGPYRDSHSCHFFSAPPTHVISQTTIFKFCLTYLNLFILFTPVSVTLCLKNCFLYFSWI